MLLQSKRSLFAKAMRTGGKYEPRVFVHMFDAALEPLAEEWRLLGLGFKLHGSGELVANVKWLAIHSFWHQTSSRLQASSRGTAGSGNPHLWR